VSEPTIRTHNAYHLGDNLIHLNFLRRIALNNSDRQFVHYCDWHLKRQLKDVVQDVPNIKLLELNYLLPNDSIDAWRGAHGHWYNHPNRNDFVGYHLEWFESLSERMGVENTVKIPGDMLFDYPAIIESTLDGVFQVPFDVLVVNSAPGSGQFRNFDKHGLSMLASQMAKNGLEVVVTSPVPNYLGHVPSTSSRGLSVTQIGTLSLHCSHILMVSTGPSWPTFNVWNLNAIKNRIILLDEERINLSPNTFHCTQITEASEVLKQCGLL